MPPRSPGAHRLTECLGCIVHRAAARSGALDSAVPWLHPANAALLSPHPLLCHCLRSSNAFWQYIFTPGYFPLRSNPHRLIGNCERVYRSRRYAGWLASVIINAGTSRTNALSGIEASGFGLDIGPVHPWRLVVLGVKGSGGGICRVKRKAAGTPPGQWCSSACREQHSLNSIPCQCRVPWSY